VALSRSWDIVFRVPRTKEPHREVFAMGNLITHFEIGAADKQQLVTFYREVFGWRMDEVADGYTIVDTQAGAGINGGIGRSSDGTPWVSFYVADPDPDALLARAHAAGGGGTVVPVTEIEGWGTFAMFKDPDGNLVGIVKSDPTGGAPLGVGGSTSGEGIAVDWFEVLGADAARTQRFYTELFGWKLNDSGEPATAWSTPSRDPARSAAGSAAAATTSGRPSTPAFPTSRRSWRRPRSMAAPGSTGRWRSTTT
jgi:predicted enzyme related to lactoylglutathione lyase